jgi:hypothetical protein
MTIPSPCRPPPTRTSSDTTAGTGCARRCGHRSRRPPLLRDRGQRGAGIGEPRRTVRRQPPDEPACGADEQREHPEDRQRPPLHPAAEQDLAQAQPGALAARKRHRGSAHRRRWAEGGGAGRVAPRVVGAGPQRRIVRRGIRACVRRPLQRGPVCCRTAEGQRERRGAGRSPSIRRQRRPRRGRRRTPSGRPKAVAVRHRPRPSSRARTGGSGAVRSGVRPWRPGAGRRPHRDVATHHDPARSGRSSACPAGTAEARRSGGNAQASHRSGLGWNARAGQPVAQVRIEDRRVAGPAGHVRRGGERGRPRRGEPRWHLQDDPATRTPVGPGPAPPGRSRRAGVRPARGPHAPIRAGGRTGARRRDRAGPAAGKAGSGVDVVLVTRGLAPDQPVERAAGRTARPR